MQAQLAWLRSVSPARVEDTLGATPSMRVCGRHGREKTYDGLYRITRAWKERGKDSHIICRQAHGPSWLSTCAAAFYIPVLHPIRLLAGESVRLYACSGPKQRHTLPLAQLVCVEEKPLTRQSGNPMLTRAIRAPGSPIRTCIPASPRVLLLHRFCMVPIPGHSHVSEIVLAKVVNTHRRFR